MKAEIILTDNNIDLNEPTIDVSTEDGFSVTIIGGVGPQGAKGDSPVRGRDYWTEADQAAIINAVLAALPVAEGVSF